MPRPRPWTDDDLRAALALSTTTQDLCDRLGVKPGGKTYASLRQRAAELGLDASHLATRPPQQRRRITDEALKDAVAKSWTYSDVCRNVGVKPAGANFATLRSRIERLALSTEHFTHEHWRRAKRQTVKRPLEQLLQAGLAVQSTGLRKRLLAEGVKGHHCEACGLTEWRGVPIPLELDHINGLSDDNRLENLRLLCPNCHAQTDTYRGRNIGKYRDRVTAELAEVIPLRAERRATA